MHVIIATDGSKQSLQAARYLRSVADPESITSVSVLAVVSPLAAVPFATESDSGHKDIEDLSFRTAAQAATAQVAAELDGWGPKISQQIRSGSPASEILKAAKAKDTGLIVVASQSSRASAVLMGSVAHRVLNQATCPVLVVRPGAKPKKVVRKK
ncbi:universal stress protein [Aeromicrobium fastidiosum]|uniref:Universal stress protein n=1 Tax=Aeromicrobium fastidiosum TaxID=52699 RepID=A0A641AVQ0_9ACTN|nr:universal stress protein [Aeromicrobium fastidiosum]KAA1380888.1 universal stress protein [Aeromicrobium fastidiosum]MBP2389521.1 nucleotide-binding universal stress UspA family protein [Aeromicrobium fastidiosum]